MDVETKMEFEGEILRFYVFCIANIAKVHYHIASLSTFLLPLYVLLILLESYSQYEQEAA